MKPTVSLLISAIILTLAFVVFAWLFLTLWPVGFLNHDVAWFTMVGGKVLAGAKLYKDYIEPNAPLASISMAPAALLHNIIGIGLPAAVTAWVFTIIVATFILFVGATRRIPLAPTKLLVLQVLTLSAMILSPGTAFGEREHLFAILATPYAVAVALRASRAVVTGGFGALVGFAAAIGTGMKPPLVLVIVAIELVSIFRTRKIFHPELVTLVLTLLVYMILTWIYFPGFFDILFGWAISLYSGYAEMPGPSFILAILVLFGLAPMLWRDARIVPEIKEICGIFAAAALGASVAYLVQWKGWLYQGYPAIYFALIGGLFSSVASARANTSGLVRGLASVAILTPTYLLSATTIGNYKNVATRELGPILDRVNGSFMALSTMVTSGFPIGAEHRGGWAFRYPCLILVPGLVKAAAANGGKTPERYRALESAFRAAIVEDIQNNKPAIIAIPRGADQALPHDFKIFHWLNMDKAFGEALSDYIETGGTKDFRIFKRRS